MNTDDAIDLKVGIFAANTDETDFLILGEILFMDSPVITTLLNNTRQASLVAFGHSLTKLDSQYRDVIIASRFVGSKKFNTMEYSTMQLISFILTDSSAFWTMNAYKRFTLNFLLLFPKVDHNHTQVRLITTGDIIAICTGILTNYTVEIVCRHLECNTDDTCYPHYAVLLFILADIFIHRICRIIYRNESEGFSLQYVGFHLLAFGLTSLPRFPIHGVLCLGYSLESSQTFHSCESFNPLRQTGTFGFVHYANSSSIETVMLQAMGAQINVYGIPYRFSEEVLVVTPIGDIEDGAMITFYYDIV